MARRLILGVLLAAIGLLCVVSVSARDEDKNIYNDPDLAYQEALRRIEVAQRTGSKKLILSYLSFLETLPPEIAHLKKLEVLSFEFTSVRTLPPEIGQLTQLRWLNGSDTYLTSLPSEIGNLKELQTLKISHTYIKSLPYEIGYLAKLHFLALSYTSLTTLPHEIGHLTQLQELSIFGVSLIFPPPEILSQGTPAILAYLRDYEAMLMRQTIAGIAAGVGGIAGVMLAFRWRQRRGLHEKKKRA